jgi:hypothetical protein
MSSGMATRRTLGILFLLLGIVIMAPAILPALFALAEHPPRVVPISVIPLMIGIPIALFGALMIPFSGADIAATKLQVILRRTSLPYVGGGASGDAGGGTSGETSVEVTATTSPPAEPPKDGTG